MSTVKDFSVGDRVRVIDPESYPITIAPGEEGTVISIGHTIVDVRLDTIDLPFYPSELEKILE